MAVPDRLEFALWVRPPSSCVRSLFALDILAAVPEKGRSVGDFARKCENWQTYLDFCYQSPRLGLGRSTIQSFPYQQSHQRHRFPPRLHRMPSCFATCATRSARTLPFVSVHYFKNVPYRQRPALTKHRQNYLPLATSLLSICLLRNRQSFDQS